MNDAADADARLAVMLALISYAVGFATIVVGNSFTFRMSSAGPAVLGGVTTIVLNTLAIHRGSRAKRAYPPARSAAASWAIALGTLGYLGSAVLLLGAVGPSFR